MPLLNLKSQLLLLKDEFLLFIVICYLKITDPLKNKSFFQTQANILWAD